MAPRADLKSWTPATELCQSVRVLILGRKQDKEAKPSPKLQASPSLLISGCYIFQPQLVTMLVRTGVQAEQFQML